MAELKDAVRQYASDLADKINTFVKDVTTLEVRTYTTPADQEAVLVKTKFIDDFLTEGKVAMRAGTSISFEGDITQLAPLDDKGEIRQDLWALHQEAVKQAMQHRERMLTSLGQASESALRALRAANG